MPITIEPAGAGQAVLEDTQRQTVGGSSVLELLKFETISGQSVLEGESLKNIAGSIVIEDETLNTFSGESVLEDVVITSYAGSSVLQGLVLTTIGGTVVFSFLPASPGANIDVFDQRGESNARPVTRIKVGNLTIPAGDLQAFVAIRNKNLTVMNIGFRIPEIGAATAQLQIVGETGAIFFDSGALADNSSNALIPDPKFSLAGDWEARITMSASQASDTEFDIIIYGV